MGGMNGRLRDFYMQRGMMLRLHMDLLYACDLDCHHCYLDDKSRPQVTAEAMIDVLEQAAELGAMNVTFSGGEIFLRKDLFTILEGARKLRYNVRLKTHGGRITPEDARRVAELGISNVDFSVYALDEEVHDAFTKRAGSLRRTLRGIDLLKEAGVVVEVKCSVTTFNVSHYRELVEHFRSRGIKATFNARIRGTNGVTTTTYPLNVSYEDKVQVEIYRLETSGGPRQKRTASRPEESHFCFAGRTTIYVGPDLKVYPCSAFPLEVGDLTRQSLREIWEQATGLKAVRATTRADTGICGTCAARAHCTYCPGAAFIENDGESWSKPPEIICRDAFARLEAEERYLEGERCQHAVSGPAPRRKRVRFPILNNAGRGGT